MTPGSVLSDTTAEPLLTRTVLCRIEPFLEGLTEADRTRLLEALLGQGLDARPAWSRRLVALEAASPCLFRDRISLAQAAIAGA